jgi:hypothetical protein
MNIMKAIYKTKLLAVLLSASLLMGCEKEEELVVDRVVSPVLVTFAGAVSYAAAEPVKVTTTVYELDKSGLLNHAVGIDSIPLANMALTVKLGNNALAQLTTDAAGRVVLEKTWAELGLASPRAGNTVTLEWAGSHKGQAFAKQQKVQVK